MMKKKLYLLLSFVMVTMMLAVFSITASAGSSIATATEIEFNTTYSGTLNNNSEMYKFELPSSGRVQIDVTAYIQRTDYYFYDAEGNELWESTWQEWNGNTQVYKLELPIDLTEGTYYFSIHSGMSGDYNIKIGYTDAEESFAEPRGGNNNSIREADVISLNKTYKGQLAMNDNKDLYKITLKTSGLMKIDLSAYLKSTNYFLYDAEGNEIWENTWQEWNGTTQVYKMYHDYHLTEGTYYFAISNNYSTGNYTFKIGFTSANEYFAEPQGGNNNSIAEADAIVLNKTYKGQLAANDEKDFYKFTLKNTGKIILNVSAKIRQTHYYLYNAEGNEVWKSTWRYWNDTTQTMEMAETVDLAAGTYYFALSRTGGDGNYTLQVTCSHTWKTTSVKKASLTAAGTTYQKCAACSKTRTIAIAKPATIKLSATTYTYNGGIKTPNVTVKDSAGKTLLKNTDYTVTYASGRKNAGTYNVVVTMQGKYTGKKTLSYKIIPQKVAKCSVKLSTTSYIYNGAVKTPAVTVKSPSGTTLKKNKDYTVTYVSGRKNVGTYKVTVKMRGNYSGTRTLTFKIKPAGVSKCSSKLSATSYIYNGKVKTPTVTMKYAGKTLKKGTDYTITYASGRKNVGTYKVTVKMRGNYTGTKALTFKILPKTASAKTLTAKSKALTVKLNRQLTQSTGYQIQYATNKNFRSAKIKTVANYKTSSVTLTGLKAKTIHFVRVRTYKKVGSTTYYSNWSPIKYIKTK